MRRHSARGCRLTHAYRQTAGEVGCRKRSTIAGKKEGPLGRIGDQAGPGLRKVELDRLPGRFADRHQPVLGSLAEHPDQFVIEIDRVQGEGQHFLAAEPAGVGQLEHRPVTDLQRRTGRNCVQHPGHLLGGQHLWQLRLAAGCGNEVGRILADPSGPQQEPVKAPDRRQLPGHGGRSPPGSRKRRGVPPQVLVTDLIRLQAGPASPVPKLAQIAFVGDQGSRRGSRRGQVTPVELERIRPVRAGRFPGGRFSRCRSEFRHRPGHRGRSRHPRPFGCSHGKRRFRASNPRKCRGCRPNR